MVNENDWRLIGIKGRHLERNQNFFKKKSRLKNNREESKSRLCRNESRFRQQYDSVGVWWRSADRDEADHEDDLQFV